MRQAGSALYECGLLAQGLALVKVADVHGQLAHSPQPAAGFIPVVDISGVLSSFI